MTPEERSYLAEFLSGFIKPATIVEAGMCDGDECEFILANLPLEPAHYIGVECDPRNIQTIRNRGLDRKIDFIPHALSRRTGSAILNMSGDGPPGNSDWSKSSSLRDPSVHQKLFGEISFKKKVQVTTLTLDGICDTRGISGIDLLWMDVEGSEIDIIDGGTRVIPNTRFIYTEFWSNVRPYAGMATESELLAALDGFEVVKRFDSDMLLRNKSL